MNISIRILLIAGIFCIQVQTANCQDGQLLMGKGESILYSNTDSARIYFDKAYFAFMQSSDSALAFTCKYLYSSTYFVERNFQQAFDTLLKHKDEILRAKFKNRDVLGLYYNGLGFTSRDLNKFKEGEEYLLSGISLYKQKETSETLSKLYSNLSTLYKLKGEYLKAENVLMTLLESGESSEETLMYLYSDLADLYSRFLIQPEKAQTFLDKTLNITERLYGKSSVKYGDRLLTKGSTYFYNQDFKMAIRFWASAKDIYEKKADIEGVSFVLNNIGRAYQELNDYDNAIEYTKQSLVLKEKILGRNHISTLLSYANLGRLYLFEGNISKSNQYIDLSIKQLNLIFGESHPELARVYGFKAYNLAAEGKYKLGIEALYAGYRAVAVLNPRENKVGPPNAVPFTPDIYASLLSVHASLLNDSIKSSSFNARLADWALECLHLGDEALMNIRYGILPKDAIASAGVDIEFYKLASAVCYSFYSYSKNEKYFNEFLFFSDKQKGFNLLLATQERERPDGLIPQNVVDKELRFRQQIGQQLTNIKMGATSDSLMDIQIQYNQLLSDIGQQYPAYNSWKFGTTPAKLEKIQDVLGDRAVIDYVVTDSILFITVITAEDKKIISLSILHDELDKMINTFRTAMLSKSIDDADRTGYQLYKLLIQPAEDLLKMKGQRHVMIIPDGSICYVPFEALVKKPKVNPIEKYLFKDYVFSTHYNLSLALKKNKAERSSMDFMAFAPVYNSHSKSMSRNALRELPFAQKEAASVASLLGGRLMKGEEASVGNFKKFVKNASIIHIASHILLNEFNPDESSIVFSTDESTEELNELSTYELYTMNLEADLVTLSGCNSGTGKIRNGEGVMSIARGFMYAGCANIVMSLWPVNDESTAELMGYFYSNLKNGQPKDQALTNAKLTYLENADPIKSHPYYWAGFVFSGDPRALDFGYSNLQIVVAIISILAVFILLLIVWRRYF